MGQNPLKIKKVCPSQSGMLFLEEYKQYFISNNDLWDYNLTELKDFMRKNKKKPSKNEKKTL